MVCYWKREGGVVSVECQALRKREGGVVSVECQVLGKREGGVVSVECQALGKREGGVVSVECQVLGKREGVLMYIFLYSGHLLMTTLPGSALLVSWRHSNISMTET